MGMGDRAALTGRDTASALVLARLQYEGCRRTFPPLSGSLELGGKREGCWTASSATVPVFPPPHLSYSFQYTHCQMRGSLKWLCVEQGILCWVLIVWLVHLRWEMKGSSHSAMMLMSPEWVHFSNGSEGIFVQLSEEKRRCLWTSVTHFVRSPSCWGRMRLKRGTKNLLGNLEIPTGTGFHT